jgi:alpha-galactosidase
MSNEDAQSILNGGNGTASNATRTEPYNATATSYAEGLKDNATVLYGVHVGTIAPSGTFSAKIARYLVGVYLLRSQGNTSIRKRDKL